tara:strand:- start:16207 stop:16539 length:333 start_codon:yes stop_codon:yes gene_type:complete
MASETFKNAGIQGVTNADNSLLTVASGHTYIIRTILITETAGNAETYNLWWTDSSNGDAVTYIQESQALSANGNVNISRLLILEAGDVLHMQCDDAADVDVTINYVDQTL